MYQELGEGLTVRMTLNKLALEVASGLALQLQGEDVQAHEPAPRRRRQARQVR